MTSIDDLVEAVISQNPKVSRETLLERLEEERKKSGGLISDEVLLRMIAAELGVKLVSMVLEPSLAIGSLIAGLNDVSVTGRVIAVYPPKVSGKTYRSKLASVLVADKTGMVRVILWNDKAELVSSGRIKAGRVVKFIHGYTREGRLGRIELHIGEKGDVETLENVEAKGYPEITELATKIAEAIKAPRNKRVNIIGKVGEILREATFEKEGSATGKVMRFTLIDETGEVPVIVWNEKVDEAKKILKKEGMLQIVNAKVKKASDGRVEVHVDRETYMDVLTVPPKEEFWKIAELKEGMKNIAVQGIVVTKPLMRKVKTTKGETMSLTVFEIKDETGSIWVSAWRKNAEKTANLKPGEKIAIKNVDVKRGFADQLEITTKNKTIIETLSQH